MDNKIYDVVILGAGPAGLAAGLYAGRSRLSVLILEKGIFSYLESNTKILYNIEKSEQFAGFPVYTNNEAASQIPV